MPRNQIGLIKAPSFREASAAHIRVITCCPQSSLNEFFVTAAPWALVFVVLAFLLVCTNAEEQEAHSFQPGSHISPASDADMMKAIR